MSPVRVVAPINVKRGKSSRSDLAAGPLPRTMSSWKSSIAGYKISSTGRAKRWISSTNNTSPSERFVSNAAKSPARTSAGPDVTRSPASISLATMPAEEVLPRPGGPEKSMGQTGSPRRRAASSIIERCSFSCDWPTNSSRRRGRRVTSSASSSGRAEGASKRGAALGGSELTGQPPTVGVLGATCLLTAHLALSGRGPSAPPPPRNRAKQEQHGRPHVVALPPQPRRWQHRPRQAPAPWGLPCQPGPFQTEGRARGPCAERSSYLYPAPGPRRQRHPPARLGGGPPVRAARAPRRQARARRRVLPEGARNNPARRANKTHKAPVRPHARACAPRGRPHLQPHRPGQRWPLAKQLGNRLPQPRPISPPGGQNATPGRPACL